MLQITMIALMLKRLENAKKQFEDTLQDAKR